MAIPVGPLPFIAPGRTPRSHRLRTRVAGGAAGQARCLSWRAVAAVLAVLLLSGCDRDRESALRAQLDQWFYLGRTSYFESHMRCTAAMIHVTVDRPRSSLPVQSHPERARDAFRTDGIAAVRIDGVSPAALTEFLLLSGAGSLGKQALAAGALAGPCFEGTKTRAYLYEALTRPGAMLAYDSANAGLMILDPARYVLFYVAGDVW